MKAAEFYTEALQRLTRVETQMEAVQERLVRIEKRSNGRFVVEVRIATASAAGAAGAVTGLLQLLGKL